MTSSRITLWPIVRVVILGLVAGGGAGVVTAVWTSQALSDYAERLQTTEGLPRISITQPTPIPGTYEEAISRVRDRSKTAVAVFLPHSVDATVPSGWRSQQDAVAYGALVSDDGWIACDKSAFDDVKEDIDALDVWIAQTRYTITDVVEEESTGLVMVHVDGKNFVSVDFATTEDVQAGTMMFAVTDASVLPSAVVAADYHENDGVFAAETFTTEWLLSLAPEKSVPLLNAAGYLAGFTRTHEMNALPLHHVLSSIRDVVKSGALSAPVLGAYGIDLSSVLAMTPSVRQDLRAGFLVVAPNSSTRAVVVGGPADVAGIALGDVILAVDGETVSEATTLAELLAAYDAGSVARFTIYRGGEMVMISVTLGDQSTVLY